ncbi:hypothetical protein NLX86_31685 [Streptomyces sp. A3M-1-3]|uniref:hypothetical protein n=1 Tax=Streptomyces sp. A3M-1-3 TaxID=2962044 RepID=UPI0020B67F2A|nr:hypothetical protein [Streptomyces sp. A3M-1-3]MCP3822485.1 hypothetical protein [Streptomyces sp. A3M-1-3]
MSSQLRLLPWTGPEGKPALLVTDGTSTMLSRLADDIEATQLSTGAEVLTLSRAMLTASERLAVDEALFLAQRLAECLADALRVSESRGLRIPPYDE